MSRDKMRHRIPEMVVMVGMSRCGKSTVANQLAREGGLAIVSGDDIRRSLGVEFDRMLEPTVQYIQYQMARALLIRGQSIIIDETNLTVARRARWIELGREMCARVFLHVVRPPTDLEVWQRRCIEDNFLWSVVESQIAQFEDITAEEVEAVGSRPHYHGRDQ